MKKLHIPFFLTLVSCISLSAQTNPTSSDPEAKKILDAVSAKFKTFTGVKASFTYNVENGSGKVLSTQSGSLQMKGMKYRISFNGQEIFCNGTNVWNYDKSANEVTLSKLDASGGMITPQKLFTNFYDKDFYYRLNGDKKIGNKTYQEIELTPKDKDKPFHKVYVLVDKVGKTIYSTKVLENGGNRYSYTVTSLNTNSTLADSMFVFDKTKYPGVEEIDLQ